MGDTRPSEPVAWHLTRLFRGRDGASASKDAGRDPLCLVVLNQPLDRLPVLRSLWENSVTRVAADGGANRLYEAGGARGDASFDNLDVVIGDLDSLRDDARRYFESRPRPARVIHDPDQYSTDFGKAVSHIRRSHPGVVDIVAVGGLGGRVDQGLSQLHHLYLFQKQPRYAEGRMYLVSGESVTFLLQAGRHRIEVRDDDGGGGGGEDVFAKYVGIIPIKEKSRITTRGLEWDVEDWETQFGGQLSTSNHVLPDTRVVEVETTTDVLFTIALRAE
ncbi:hypothetical protein VTK73DRAFT_2854 [Phialemonium thermophilum]|uniref:Thiamine pyrophosphokinase n=1 Tax=Phialemonium thermophilum TaxID=223376 RepID=A0ABR3VP27_9PEZI